MCNVETRFIIQTDTSKEILMCYVCINNVSGCVSSQGSASIIVVVVSLVWFGREM